MDPVALGVPHRLPGPVDVLEPGAGQAGDDRALHRLGDGLDRLEVAVAGDREPGLDDVDPEARELVGDLELLADVERDAGRLLAVPQGRVEDQDLVHRGPSSLVCRVRVVGFRQTKTSRPEGTRGLASTGSARPYVRSSPSKCDTTVIGSNSLPGPSRFRQRPLATGDARECRGVKLMRRGAVARPARRRRVRGLAVPRRPLARHRGRDVPDVTGAEPPPPGPRIDARPRPPRRRAARRIAERPARRRPGAMPIPRPMITGSTPWVEPDRRRVPGEPPGEGEAHERHLPRARRRQLRPHPGRPLLRRRRRRHRRRPPRPEALADAPRFGASCPPSRGRQRAPKRRKWASRARWRGRRRCRPGPAGRRRPRPGRQAGGDRHRARPRRRRSCRRPCRRC